MFSLWCIDWVWSLYANRILCIFVLRVASGPRVKLARCKRALNPSAVYSTDLYKAVVPVLVLLFVALWFILRGDLFYVLPCVILFLCFPVLLALRLPRLWLWHSLDFSFTFLLFFSLLQLFFVYASVVSYVYVTFGWSLFVPNHSFFWRVGENALTILIAIKSELYVGLLYKRRRTLGRFFFSEQLRVEWHKPSQNGTYEKKLQRKPRLGQQKECQSICKKTEYNVTVMRHIAAE